MKIRNLVHIWKQAVDDASIGQQRADETDEMLNTRSGLRAGLTFTKNFCPAPTQEISGCGTTQRC